MSAYYTPQYPAVEKILSDYKAQYGYVPNLWTDLAKYSPAAFYGYYYLYYSVENYSKLSKAEYYALMLYYSGYSKYEYGRAAYSYYYSKAEGYNAADAEALYNGKYPTSPYLRSLIEYADKVYQKRGYLTPQEYAYYETQGVTKQKQLDVYAVYSLYTLYYYSYAITNSKLDAYYTPYQYSYKA